MNVAFLELLALVTGRRIWKSHRLYAGDSLRYNTGKIFLQMFQFLIEYIVFIHLVNQNVVLCNLKHTLKL